MTHRLVPTRLILYGIAAAAWPGFAVLLVLVLTGALAIEIALPAALAIAGLLWFCYGCRVGDHLGCRIHRASTGHGFVSALYLQVLHPLRLRRVRWRRSYRPAVRPTPDAVIYYAYGPSATRSFRRGPIAKMHDPKVRCTFGSGLNFGHRLLRLDAIGRTSGDLSRSSAFRPKRTFQPAVSQARSGL